MIPPLTFFTNFNLYLYERFVIRRMDDFLGISFDEEGKGKKGYALFESPEKSKPSRWKVYFAKAIKHSHE